MNHDSAKSSHLNLFLASQTYFIEKRARPATTLLNTSITGCFVHTMGFKASWNHPSNLGRSHLFNDFCPILLSILVLQIFHLRLEVPQASQVYCWWQPEILRRFTSWGKLVVEIPLFIRVSETSQVVGNGINEPSTVCCCKTCEHGKGWIPEILKHPHYLQENAPFTASTWNLSFFEGIIWIITPQPFGKKM